MARGKAYAPEFRQEAVRLLRLGGRSMREVAAEGTLPGVVPLEMVLARNEKVAVCVTRLAGYPTGFEFELVTMTSPGESDLDLDPMLFRHHRPRARRGEQGLDPDLLRIGVQFADGAKATNTGGFQYDQEPPAGPVMHSGGGGGGGRRWRQEMWVWPLPPPGPVAFVCERPAADVPLSRAELDAQTILDAAGRAQVIFPEHPSDLSHFLLQKRDRIGLRARQLLGNVTGSRKCGLRQRVSMKPSIAPVDPDDGPAPAKPCATVQGSKAIPRPLRRLMLGEMLARKNGVASAEPRQNLEQLPGQHL